MIIPGNIYNIYWVDGLQNLNCTYIKFDRGFHVFHSHTGEKIVCRPENISRFELVEL